MDFAEVRWEGGAWWRRGLVWEREVGPVELDVDVGFGEGLGWGVMEGVE